MEMGDLRMKAVLSAALALALSSLGCDRHDDQTPRDPGAGSAGSAGLASAPLDSGAPPPDGGSALDLPAPYPLSAIKAIPDQCASPKVVVATVPANAAHHYAWTLTRQAALANPQFNVVSSPPQVSGQIFFRQLEIGRSGPDGKGATRSLVAYCKDGGTCNRFAAMHLAVVRSSNPEPVCGNVPGASTDYQAVDIQWNGLRGDLPTAKDTPGLCARLGACMITLDRATPGDPIRECQEAPSAWKTMCGLKRSCAGVLACMRE